MFQKVPFLAAMASTLLFSMTCHAEEGKKAEEAPKPPKTSSEIVWGKHIAGPKISKAEDLKGKIVLLVLWGS